MSTPSEQVNPRVSDSAQKLCGEPPPVNLSPYFSHALRAVEVQDSPTVTLPRDKRVRARSWSLSSEPCDSLPVPERRRTSDVARKLHSVTGDEADLQAWWAAEQAVLECPLFSFYLRLFTRLYTRLLRCKPLLIQERVADDPWKLLIAVMLLNKTAGKAAIPIFWDLVGLYPSPLSLSQANECDLQSILRPLGLQRTRAKRLIRLSERYISDPPMEHLPRRSAAPIYLVSVEPPSPLLPLSTILPNTYPPELEPSVLTPSPDLVTALDPVVPAISCKRVRTRYPPTPISHLPGTGPYALDSYRIFCTFPHLESEWKSVMPADKELIRYLKWKWAFQERKIWQPSVGVIKDVDSAYLECLADDLSANVI